MSLTQTNKLSKLQVERLRMFGQNVNRLGANFAVFDSEGLPVEVCETSVFQSDWKLIYASFAELLKNNRKDAGNKVYLTDDSVLSAVLSCSGLELFTFINLPQKTQLSWVAKEKYVLQDKQLQAILFDYLSLLVDNFQSRLKADKSVQVFTRELSQVYEELSLIHKLSACMKISDSDRNFLKMACQSLSDIVNVDGISILLEDEATGSLVRAAG